MPLRQLDHVQLAMPPGREAEARDFYGGLLGLPEVPKPTALAGRGGCCFEQGALKVHLGVEPAFQPARKAHPAFLVDDLPTLRRTLREAGCCLTEDAPLDGLHRLFVADPFGNRIELLEQV